MRRIKICIAIMKMGSIFKLDVEPIEMMLCHINPLEGHEIMLGKQWIDERHVSYNQETCIFKFFF